MAKRLEISVSTFKQRKVRRMLQSLLLFIALGLTLTLEYTYASICEVHKLLTEVTDLLPESQKKGIAAGTLEDVMASLSQQEFGQVATSLQKDLTRINILGALIHAQNPTETILRILREHSDSPVVTLPLNRSKLPAGFYVQTYPSGVEVLLFDILNPHFKKTKPTALTSLKSIFGLFILDKLVTPQHRKLAIENSVFLNNVYQLDKGDSDHQKHYSGIDTYVAKLGPLLKSLGMLSHPPDWFASGSLMTLETSNRVFDMIDIERDILSEFIQKNPSQRDITVFSVAGGPSFDWISTLQLGSRTGYLKGKSVKIIVLDRDPYGPEFGRQSLKNFTEQGRFKGVEVTMIHEHFDWSDSSHIDYAIEKHGSPDILTSEGGLGEYASSNVLRSIFDKTHQRAEKQPLTAFSYFRHEKEMPRAIRNLKTSSGQDWNFEGPKRFELELGRHRQSVEIKPTGNTVYGFLVSRPE